jgi:hypothetical protein
MGNRSNRYGIKPKLSGCSPTKPAFLGAAVRGIAWFYQHGTRSEVKWARHLTQVSINAGYITGGLGGATAALMLILMIAPCLVALREPHPGGFPTSGLFLSVNLALSISFTS